MARALFPPLLALALLLTGYTALEANSHIASLLLQEARTLALEVRGMEGASLPGVRWTPQPESPLPLLGETWEALEVREEKLRAVVAVPAPKGALEVEKGASPFVPRWWPGLLLALAAGFWAWLRVQAVIYRTLGLNLASARQQLLALKGALDSLDEGVLVLEGKRAEFFNPRALELLSLPKQALPPLPLERVWPLLEDTLQEKVEEAFLALPGRRMARVRILGSKSQRVVVIQDQAELLRMAESLTQSRRMLELLRAQAHEFRNTLHVIGGLLEMGRVEEALKLIQGELGAEARVADLLSHVQLPLLAALLLGKLRRAHELGVELEVEGMLPSTYAPLADVLVAVVGHLLENALEAASSTVGGRVVVRFFEDSGLWLEVRDNGWGPPKGVEQGLFAPGVSGKGVNRGYGLALTRYQVEAAGGQVGYYRENEWTVFYAHFPGKR